MSVLKKLSNRFNLIHIKIHDKIKLKSAKNFSQQSESYTHKHVCIMYMEKQIAQND